MLASIGLVLPKQTADELNALSDMQAEPTLLPGVLVLQVSLGLLALSAWYWAKAAFSASFGADDSLETRPGMCVSRRAVRFVMPRRSGVAEIAGHAVRAARVQAGFRTHRRSTGWEVIRLTYHAHDVVCA